MNDPRATAQHYVEQMLARRLKRGGTSTSRPEWYFQCEAGTPEPYADGFQVRVRTWRHWSDALVTLNADDGEVLGCTINRFTDPVTQVDISEEEAVAAASSAMEIPHDAELESFFMVEYAPNRRMAELRWQHVIEGLRVHGDYLRVVLHPVTHRIVAFGRKWSTVRLQRHIAPSP